MQIFLIFFFFIIFINLAQYPRNWRKHLCVCATSRKSSKNMQLVVTKPHTIYFSKPHTIYFSINLTPWTNQFIQYGLYVIKKFVLCHGYEKILQTLNSTLVLLYVCCYAFTLAKQFLAEGRYVFLVNLVHLHVLQYFFAVAKEFLAVGTRDVFLVLLRFLVFLKIIQFHVFNQFCIINAHFLADSTFLVLCFLVAGLRLCFK